MLSITHTIPDIKKKLMHDYAYFGFTDDQTFVDYLLDAVNEVRLNILIPKIEESLYNSIQAKDKTGLSLDEERIYWAEVYFACSLFLRVMELSKSQSGESTSESLTVEGYSYSKSSSSLSSSEKGNKMGAINYYSKGVEFLVSAGYDMLEKMHRRGFSR